MREYKDPQNITREEELEDGAYRLLRMRRQSEAFRDRTRAASQSQGNAPSDPQTQEDLAQMTEREAQLRIKAFLEQRSNSMKEE